VRWQRLGMSRAKVRFYEKREAAERFALKLQGRMDEAYPELNGNEPHCCGGSWDCDCGGETWYDRWERESAQVPPLIRGPEVDYRPVGDWRLWAHSYVRPLPEAVVEAFEDGGRRWPIPEPVPTGADEPDDDLEDIPF
jgi:hypothetical protein